MHVRNCKVPGKQGRLVQFTLYARKCCISEGLDEKIIDRGDECAPAGSHTAGHIVYSCRGRSLRIVRVT